MEKKMKEELSDFDIQLITLRTAVEVGVSEEDVKKVVTIAYKSMELCKDEIKSSKDFMLLLVKVAKNMDYDPEKVVKIMMKFGKEILATRGW